MAGYATDANTTYAPQSVTALSRYELSAQSKDRNGDSELGKAAGVAGQMAIATEKGLGDNLKAGSNGKWYSNPNTFGNQHFTATRLAPIAKAAGHGFAALSLGMSFAEYRAGKLSGWGLAGDFALAAAELAHPVGWGIGIAKTFDDVANPSSPRHQTSLPTDSLIYLIPNLK